MVFVEVHVGTHLRVLLQLTQEPLPVLRVRVEMGLVAAGGFVVAGGVGGVLLRFGQALEFPVTVLGAFGDTGVGFFDENLRKACVR